MSDAQSPELNIVREIAITALSKLVSPCVAMAVNVVLDTDSMDELAYFFQLEFPQKEDREKAVLLHVELIHELRDRLIEQGNNNYPYVMINSPPSDMMPRSA